MAEFASRAKRHGRQCRNWRGARAFFPWLSLTTSLGFISPATSSLFDGGQRVWSFAPPITLPLFQRGKLRAELRLAEVRKSSAVAKYERAIQVSRPAMPSATSRNATFGRQIEAQIRAVASAERRTKRSNLRYRAGVNGRLDLLVSQR
jgi:outer membrane protein, multidrug efflux system